MISSIMGMGSNVYSGNNVSRKYFGNNVNNNSKKSYSVFLNKAYSKDIVSYANNLYKNVIALKDSSKDLKEFVDEYETVEDNIDTLDDVRKEKIIDILQQKVQKFVDDYDRAYEFADKQKMNSGVLKEFFNELCDIGGEHEQILQKLEIAEREDGTLDVGVEVKDFENKKNVGEKLENIKSVVSNLNNSVRNLLINPMSEHMNFRSLNYYYNYKLDLYQYQSSSFRLIESGMILDLAL